MIQTTRKTRTPRTNILFAFVLALACYLAWLLRDELVLLYVSALFAVVLMPVVRAVERLRIGRWRPTKGGAVALMLLVVFACLAGFGFLAIPPVARDLEQLSSQPTALPRLMGRLQHVPFLGGINTEEIEARAQTFVSHAASYILIAVRDWAGKIANLITGIVLTIYFILEGDRAYRWFLSFIPPRRREQLDETLRRAGTRMGKWLLGQASLMLILGVCSTTVYALLHVRYAYALGVLTGLLNIIPVLGAAVTIVLVLLIAAIDSWTHVLGVAIFYIVYIQIENSYLTPRIMQNRVNLPGLAILVALLLGFGLAGVLGALVSVPTAVLVTELLDEYLVWKGAPFDGPP
jgi:predicted PurR-regulated permease PerM